MNTSSRSGALTHDEQKNIWDLEHASPHVLLQMDSSKPSSGVEKFWHWLKSKRNVENLNGLEMGCGKGRNVIWLAQQNIQMTGFDFSRNAILEAQKRSNEIGVQNKASFLEQDATQLWNFPSNHFDFVVDCFASTDIESYQGRKFAVSEMIRVVKPQGFILTYVMSTEDAYHKQMMKDSPAHEPHSFLHPSTGKFEKVFSREELIELYSGLNLVVEERIPKKAMFFGENYDCNHHWMIFQK